MSDRKPTNAKDRAATDRLEMALFPASAIAYGALAMTEGDLKYGAHNWREEGVAISVYVSAALRHLLKYNDGEDDDPLTGVPHLANVLACIAILVDGRLAGNIKDDRPPKVELAALLEDFRGRVRRLQGMYPSPPARFTELGAPAVVLTEADWKDVYASGPNRPAGSLDEYNERRRAEDAKHA